MTDPDLSPEETAIYEWQTWVRGLGMQGQRRLKGASVLISRCGGLGGLVAYELAAAGIGKLVIAHAGHVKPSDLHRHLLVTHDWIGKPRIESITRRLRELNPRVEVVGIAENLSTANAKRLIDQADVVVDAAPLFAERYAMNDEAVRQGKPLVECAMYEMEATLTTVLPGLSPCLRCLCPEPPATWTRQFPVLGAVSGTVGCLGAVEVIKLIASLGEPLTGRMLTMDLRSMRFRTVRTFRDPHCTACGALKQSFKPASPTGAV
jgi:molybdopterin/thiamine biosynthesis adenylyltransferase